MPRRGHLRVALVILCTRRARTKAKDAYRHYQLLALRTLRAASEGERHRKSDEAGGWLIAFAHEQIDVQSAYLREAGYKCAALMQVAVRPSL